MRVRLRLRVWPAYTGRLNAYTAVGSFWSRAEEAWLGVRVRARARVRVRVVRVGVRVGG